MKNFSSVGWTIANKGALGLKIGAVIAATSTIAITSYVISERASKQKKEKSKTSQAYTNNMNFEFDNLLFSELTTSVIPETQKEITSDIKEQGIIQDDDVIYIDLNPPMIFEALPEAKIIAKKQAMPSSSAFQLTEEDYQYFEKYGTERNITSASYIGGQEEMQKEILNKLSYPEVARENRVEGTVIVQFELKPDGEIENARVIQSVSKEIDNEALKITESIKNWNAKKVNSVPVTSIMNVPITFELN